MSASALQAKYGQCFTWQSPSGETLTWSIDDCQQLLAGREPIITASLEDCEAMLAANQWRDEINDDYAMTTNLSQPGIAIISPFNPPRETDDEINLSIILIDGWHRVRKAVLARHPEIKIHLLRPHEEQSCRVNLLASIAELVR